MTLSLTPEKLDRMVNEAIALPQVQPVHVKLSWFYGGLALAAAACLTAFLAIPMHMDNGDEISMMVADMSDMAVYDVIR